MFPIKLFIIAFFLHIICTPETVEAANLVENFRAKVVSLTDCILPEEAYDKKHCTEHYMSAYKVDRKRTWIRANFTFLEKMGPMYTNVRTYELLSNSHRNKVYEYTNLTCSHIVVASVCRLLHLNYTADCYVHPGVYVFDDFDVEELSKLLFIVWRPGRYGFEIDFRTPFGITSCFYLVVDYTNRSTKRRPTKKGTQKLQKYYHPNTFTRHLP